MPCHLDMALNSADKGYSTAWPRGWDHWMVFALNNAEVATVDKDLRASAITGLLVGEDVKGYLAGNQ